MLRAVGGLKTHLRESAAAFRGVFANPSLRWLQLAWAAVIVGHWAYLVAVSVFAYNVGGAGAVGLVIVIRTVPAALVAPFAAVLADRYSRVAVMVTSNLARAALIALAGVCVAVDAPALTVYVIVGLAMLIGTPFRPALAAVTPSVARTPAELTAANAVSSTLESIGYFVGPALAGLLLAAASPDIVFFLTAALFALSALVISRVEAPAQAGSAEGGRRSGILAEALVGFRTVGGDSRLRILLGLFSAQTLVAGALTVLIVVMAFELLDLGESGVGWLNSSIGVGALVGSIAALSLAGMRRLSPAFIGGVVLWGLPLVAIGIWSDPAVAIVLLAVVGAGNSLVDVAAFTLIQRAVPDEVLARVFGVIQFLWISTFGLGGLLIVPLIDWLGADAALIVAGAFLPVLALLTGPTLLRLDAAAEAPGAELSLLRSIPIFAPLPGTPLEHLASRLVPLHVDPQTVIVRQGDSGDRFYVVVEGEVEVAVDGTVVSELGPGGYFGEIALIRDVPRTATATARTPVVLYALERDDFLAAVTGHAPSEAAAEDVASARLASVAPTGGHLPA
ncbi:MAG TPA: MFS transporter [Gaiellaceae bacterium]|nr:MFS transporter [Gaiellaceae bacterium]